MPQTFRIDPRRGVIYSRFEGALSIEKIEAYARRVREHPAFRPGLVELCELGRVRFTGINFEALSALWQRSGNLAPADRIALVAPHPLAFGFGRMAQALAGNRGKELRVFRTRDDAEGWLFSPQQPAAVAAKPHGSAPEG